MSSISGFDATDTISQVFALHPAPTLKEFFVALAIGQGKSRSKGKKEFERRRTAFANSQPYRPANFVKDAVLAIKRDGLDNYLNYREAPPRPRRNAAAEEAEPARLAA